MSRAGSTQGLAARKHSGKFRRVPHMDEVFHHILTLNQPLHHPAQVIKLSHVDSIARKEGP